MDTQEGPTANNTITDRGGERGREGGGEKGRDKEGRRVRERETIVRRKGEGSEGGREAERKINLQQVRNAMSLPAHDHSLFGG